MIIQKQNRTHYTVFSEREKQSFQEQPQNSLSTFSGIGEAILGLQFTLRLPFLCANLLPTTSIMVCLFFSSLILNSIKHTLSLIPLFSSSPQVFVLEFLFHLLFPRWNSDALLFPRLHEFFRFQIYLPIVYFAGSDCSLMHGATILFLSNCCLINFFVHMLSPLCGSVCIPQDM